MATSMMYSYDLKEKKSNAPKVKSVLKDIDVNKNDGYDNALDKGEIEIFESQRDEKKSFKVEEEVEVNDEDFEIGSPDKFGAVTNFNTKLDNEIKNIYEESSILMIIMIYRYQTTYDIKVHINMN